MTRSPLGARIARGLLISAIAVLLAGAAAADTWRPIYPGVDYLERRTEVPQHIFVLRVDLDRDDLRLRATRSEHRGITTSRFASTYDCELAINADFYSFEPQAFSPIGLAVGAGEVWPDAADSPTHGFVAAGADNRVAIPHTSEVVNPPEPWMTEVVGGNVLLVWEGEPVDNSGCGGFCDRHPRTAAGLSEDEATLFLAVIDGRSTLSAGATLNELAALLHELGAYRALNLDGGGSTTLFVEGEGGVVNAPSGLVERPVANHLGVCLDGTFGRLTGYVREGDIYDEGAGVAGAQVRLSTGQETVTDERGRYTVYAVPTGELTITATAPGLAGEGGALITRGELSWGSVELAPLPDAGGAADAGSPDAALGAASSRGCATFAAGHGDAALVALALLAFARRRRSLRSARSATASPC
jgi:hypothetical protein